MTDLEGFIRNIEGVNDVLLKNVRGREDSAAFSAGIDLILKKRQADLPQPALPGLSEDDLDSLEHG